MSEAIHHPSYYGGRDNPYEVIKVAEAWELDKDAYLFNVLKYVGRAGKKGSTLQDLEKAAFYLNRRIEQEREAIREREQLLAEVKLASPKLRILSEGGKIESIQTWFV